MTNSDYTKIEIIASIVDLGKCLYIVASIERKLQGLVMVSVTSDFSAFPVRKYQGNSFFISILF